MRLHELVPEFHGDTTIPRNMYKFLDLLDGAVSQGVLNTPEEVVQAAADINPEFYSWVRTYFEDQGFEYDRKWGRYDFVRGEVVDHVPGRGNIPLSRSPTRPPEIQFEGQFFSTASRSRSPRVRDAPVSLGLGVPLAQAHHQLSKNKLLK